MLGATARVARVVLVCLALLPLGPVSAGPEGRKPAPAEWQYSTSLHVRLGVRDKLGSLKEYRAEFVVTSPNGRQYTTDRYVKRSDWGYVFFPDDFNTWWGRGRMYTWKCRVAGEIAARGAFDHEYMPSGKERVTVRE